MFNNLVIKARPENRVRPICKTLRSFKISNVSNPYTIGCFRGFQIGSSVFNGSIGRPPRNSSGFVASRFVLGRELAHGSSSYHYVNRLSETFKDTFLDVRYTMLFTDCFEFGGPPLVLEHRKVGPDVMFNLETKVSTFAKRQVCQCVVATQRSRQFAPNCTHLIVEESMRKINGVGTCGIVGTTNDLTDIEAACVGLDRIIERVQVLSR